MINFTHKEEATTSYGCVTVHIESYPAIGYVPEWADVGELSREIHQLLERRQKEQAERDRDGN